LMQIKQLAVAPWHSWHSNRSRPMTTEQFYFVLFVVLSFTGFGLAMGAAYVRYRRWLATQPPRRA
jgi:hypothetical protein